MKTNRNKFISFSQKHFEFIKRKLIKENDYKKLLNTELLALNYEKYSEQNRIEKLKVNTDYSQWSVKWN